SHRPAVAERGRGRHVVDLDGGGVVGIAAILVEDAAVDGVAAVVVERERRAGRGAGVGVGRGQAGGAQREAVVEAGPRVGRRRVGGAAEAHRGAAALGDRPAVGQGGRGRHVVNGDGGGVVGEGAA